MFSSVIGMVDPNGGLVITTSAERSGIALAADFTLARWPFGKGISPASATITPRRRFPNTGTSSPAKEGGMTFHLHDYSRPSESAYLMIPMTPPVGSRTIAMRPTAGMSVGPASTTPPASGTLAAHASTSSTVT